MYQELSDDDLMPLVASGNHDAFAELVTRHTQRFFLLAFRSLQNKSDAEDVVQSAFVKLWQMPLGWDSSKSQFTTWFYRVIVNACHDFRRKHARVIPLEQSLLESATPQVGCEQSRLEDQQYLRWQQNCVEAAISRLPASQRDALNLVVYCELPQKQAAQVMGVSLKALESLLVRAKKSMTCTVTELLQTEQPNAARDQPVAGLNQSAG